MSVLTCAEARGLRLVLISQGEVFHTGFFVGACFSLCLNVGLGFVPSGSQGPMNDPLIILLIFTYFLSWKSQRAICPGQVLH